ncbi:ABC transporter ATP-binding protein/permease [Lachnoclostridium sp. Marseille-P6806]|uniref:ABC transporter ATP-binding protein/permease n=1 Tax=Lachnoclostridium sp. Marseille-P6806 TaxID=2364793 RepID=UPI001A930556|nr:ABC transporter ATP-binding protein/permease [Lachnoclostridium sp. Marseille-P6806]
MMLNKRLLGLVPEAMKYIIQKVILSWASLVAGIVLWFSVGSQLQSLKDGGGLLPAVFITALLCIAVRFALTRLVAGASHRAAACVKARMRGGIYDKLRRLGGDYTDSFPTAEVVQLAGEGVEQLESCFANYIPQFFFAMLAPLTLLLVFLPLSPLTGIVLFLCVPLIPMTIVKVQRFAKRLLAKYWDAYANLSDSFLENLQGLTTLKVYGADAQRHRDMNAEAEHFRRVTMKVLTMQLNSVAVMDFVAYGGSAAGCILTAREYLRGGVSFGQAFAMVMLSAEFFLAMRALGSYFHTAMNGVAASERMFRLMDLPERKNGAETAENGDIAARHLSFSYDGEKQVLKDLCFTVPRGSLFAVAGESGCGKSTLGLILSGIRTGYEGSAAIGGTELKNASAESLRRLITVVSDGSYLFAGTVRDCLREGKEDASDEEMIEALQKVALWDFVRAQGGLGFLLGDRAENLSGGQRQRLALARALLKDSPVYLFDEATSNIDAESEAAIMEAVYAMKGKHTVLLISHRLANITGFDTIAYLERGELRELGTHAELTARNGGYAALYKAQAALEQFGKREAV